MVFGSTSPQDFADRLVMADTASAVASDTIDKLAAMTADNTSTRSYLTSVRAEIAELKRQAEAALRAAEAAAAAATTAQEPGRRREEQRRDRNAATLPPPSRTSTRSRPSRSPTQPI